MLHILSATTRNEEKTTTLLTQRYAGEPALVLIAAPVCLLLCFACKQIFENRK